MNKDCNFYGMEAASFLELEQKFCLSWHVVVAASCFFGWERVVVEVSMRNVMPCKVAIYRVVSCKETTRSDHVLLLCHMPRRLTLPIKA